jgi:hypothetical protein
MGIWIAQNLGANISQIVTADDAQDEAIRSLERGNVEPTTKPAGLLHDTLVTAILSSTGASGLGLAEVIARWNGSAWTLFCDPLQRQVNAGGTIPYVADQPMGSHKFTGLSAGSAAGHSVRYEQVILTSGANAFAANQSMGGNKITSLGTPTADADAATKLYVDSAVPVYPCSHWYNTNRDELGNGKPVVVRQFDDQTDTYTEVGFVPRRLRLRLTGTFRRQSDNDATNGIIVDGLELDVWRWNEDATGGDDGTWDEVMIGTVDGPISGTMEVWVKWKYSPGALGFYVYFIDGSGDWFNLRKTGDAGVDGTIQAQAFFGDGT